MKKIRCSLRWLLLIAPLLFASVLMADDAEIYYAQSISANPNILFVLDTSLSMECKADSNGLYDKPDTSCVNKNIVPDSGGKTRMKVMQEAFSSVMSAAPNNINVGLMRYGGHTENNANGISFPVKPIDLDKDGNGDARSILLSGIADLTKDNLPDPAAGEPVRQFLSTITNKWKAGGNTPIVDALYEATLYYRGDAVDFGTSKPVHVRASHPSTYTNDGTLNCQNNDIWCNNSTTPSQCISGLPLLDCKQESETICKQWQTVSVPGTCQECTTVQQPSTCQNCTTVQQASTCQACETVQQASTCNVCTIIGYDESGKPIKSCKNEPCMKDVQQCTDYSCMKDVQQCTNYSCMKDVKQCTNYSCMKDEQQCAQQETITNEMCRQVSASCAGGKRYTSPMEYECQANYIVLMSDGRPEYSGTQSNGGSINKYPLRKSNIQTLTNTGSNCGNNAPNGYKSGTCGPELAKFLATKDQATAHAGKQTIGTFTVAFGVDDPQGQAYLASLANMPEASYAANDTASLQLALEQVIRRVNQVDNSQVLGVDNAAYQTPDFTVTKPSVLANQQGLYQNVFGLLGAETKLVSIRTALLEFLNPIQYWQQLRSLAAVNPGAFTAGNLNDLTNSFNTILDKIDSMSSSFSSPTYSIDKGNLLAHGDNIYIPVFERSQLPLWSGNLKKFKIATKAIDADSDGVVDLEKGQIYSTKNNKPAVDSKGQFTDDAWDLWSGSASADGKPVTAGGAAAKLSPTSRNLYTDAGGSVGTLASSNAQISKILLGDPGMEDSLRDSLLAFARGYDKDGTTVRHHMGDIMNSKPVVIDYSDGKSYVIVGTNEGYLHVFDSETGAEQWAFMPQILLKNIRTFFDNNQAKTHVYGLDGQLTPWIQDKNGDGKVDKANGEHAYLFFGMRRGDRAYYALDITDMSQPKVQWSISNSDSNFAELGESWSKPALAKMRVQPDPLQPAELKDVLVFGGGFDPALEEADPSKRNPDSMGRDVFIIDAQDGKKLWSLRADVSGADAKLEHSIPGDIRVLDMDRNGALDRLYFADTGGHLWRVDMDIDIRDADSSLYDYKKARLTLFADLAGSGTDSRKFYYEPDVALMQDKGQTILTIAIGSGYRSNPLNTAISDRFYVLKDPNVYQSAPATFIALKDDNLEEADALASGGGTVLDAGKVGWYYDLPHTGEKVLAPAISFLNKVVFTTFANDGKTTDPCNAPPNSARAYVLDLFNGQAVADLDRDGSLDLAKDKFVIAGINEILGGAQVIFNAPTATNGIDPCSASDCQQTVDIRVGKMLLPVMDSTNAPGGSVASSVDLTDILPRMFWLDHNVTD